MTTEREQILALAGEPVGYVNSHPKHPDDWFSLSYLGENWKPVFTESQLLAATKPLTEENQRLRMALADTEALEIGTGERCEQLRQQLAAAQARERQYRDALENRPAFPCPSEVYAAWVDSLWEALALPQDTAALEAMIQKAGEVMRERSATVCDKRSTYYGRASAESQEAKDCAFNIRALPGVTMEDLK